MKIVAINGSLSNTSLSYGGTKHLCNLLNGYAGVEATLFSLKENPLPIYDPEVSSADVNVQQLLKELEEADGVILSTPEYHGAMSGVLKNALDFTNNKHYKGKPVSLLSACGGPSALQSLLGMQNMMRSLHATVLPTMGSIPGDSQFKEDESFVNEGMNKRFQTIATELVEAVQKNQLWANR